jgi:hypothetical protein
MRYRYEVRYDRQLWEVLFHHPQKVETIISLQLAHFNWPSHYVISINETFNNSGSSQRQNYNPTHVNSYVIVLWV